jgi:hypothetical protein
MANDIVRYEAPPAHLQKYAVTKEALKEYLVPAGATIARISLEGKAFTVKYKGEEYPNIDAQGYARPYLDVVVAVSDERTGRAYFPGAYDPAAKPVCYSLDGVRPEADAPQIQHATCHGCQWSAWNSKGKGQACKQNKRLAVLQTDYIEGNWPDEDDEPGAGAGPLLLRMPPGNSTFSNWFKYITQDLARDRRILPHGVVTRISYDPNSVWDLNFRFARYLDEVEAGWVEFWRTEPDAIEKVNRILGVSEIGDGDVLPPEPTPAPAPAPAPVQQTRQTPAPAPTTQRPANEVNPRAHPQQMVQEPRQTPTPAPATQAPAKAAAVADTPSRAPRRAAPGSTPAPAAGNGSKRASPQRETPQRATAARQDPAPVIEEPELPDPVAENGEDIDVDAEVDNLVTGSDDIFAALDKAPGIPGR